MVDCKNAMNFLLTSDELCSEWRKRRNPGKMAPLSEESRWAIYARSVPPVNPQNENSFRRRGCLRLRTKARRTYAAPHGLRLRSLTRGRNSGKPHIDKMTGLRCVLRPGRPALSPALRAPWACVISRAQRCIAKPAFPAIEWVARMRVCSTGPSATQGSQGTV